MINKINAFLFGTRKYIYRSTSVKHPSDNEIWKSMLKKLKFW